MPQERSFYDRKCDNCRYSVEIPEGHTVTRESWVLCQESPEVYIKHRRQFCGRHRFYPPEPQPAPAQALPRDVMKHAVRDGTGAKPGGKR